MNQKPIEITEEEKLRLENFHLKLAMIEQKTQALIDARADFMRGLSDKYEVDLGAGWSINMENGTLNPPEEEEGRIVPPTAAEVSNLRKVK